MLNLDSIIIGFNGGSTLFRAIFRTIRLPCLHSSSRLSFLSLSVFPFWPTLHIIMCCTSCVACCIVVVSRQLKALQHDATENAGQ